MTIEQIETFLAVITYGSISAASDYLFLSQSNVSKRIQGLEAELGVTLLLRQKGHRNVQLTNYGEAFVPIASQWAALLKDTQNIKTLANIQILNIASVDAVNNFTFVPLFNQHILKHPDIKLAINTHHSGEIHGLVESQAVDIGFVFSQVRYPDIISSPVYRELMYMVCHKDSDYHDDIHPKELNPEQEVFLRWGQDFQQWHDRHWSPDRYSLITVNTGSMLQHYLKESGRWGIAPMSVVQALGESSGLVHYRLAEAPPPRICYQLTHRHPKAARKHAMTVFEEELQKFISESDNVCRFEPWMLEVDRIV